MNTKAIRAAVTRAVGAPWVIEEVELAEPHDDEVLVRMVGSGICHTDLSCRSGVLPAPMPIVLGHEGSGVVERERLQSLWRLLKARFRTLLESLCGINLYHLTLSTRKSECRVLEEHLALLSEPRVSLERTCQRCRSHHRTHG